MFTTSLNLGVEKFYVRTIPYFLLNNLKCSFIDDFSLILVQIISCNIVNHK